MSDFLGISVKGKITQVPHIRSKDIKIIVRGRFIKTAEVFDEYWIRKKSIPSPTEAIRLIADSPLQADIFTFTQRVPDTDVLYKYMYELDNLAVITLESHEKWFRKQISSSARRNIKASKKRGVEIKVSEFDDAYIHGIMSIYNETLIRQGRKFWHYGKDFDAVKSENGTYQERSTYLAAYHKHEMIGYLKIVWDEESGAIMQILSKIKHYNRRTNNALLSAAVEQACLRHKKYLLYERYVYGKKHDDSLTEFKKKNGFERMDIPVYYVPLNLKGRIALFLRLHKSPKELIPLRLLKFLNNLRTSLYYRNT
jgi:hypothetical protein